MHAQTPPSILNSIFLKQWLQVFHTCLGYYGTKKAKNIEDTMIRDEVSNTGWNNSSSQARKYNLVEFYFACPRENQGCWKASKKPKQSVKHDYQSLMFMIFVSSCLATSAIWDDCFIIVSGV